MQSPVIVSPGHEMDDQSGPGKGTHPKTNTWHASAKTLRTRLFGPILKRDAAVVSRGTRNSYLVMLASNPGGIAAIKIFAEVELHGM